MQGLEDIRQAVSEIDRRLANNSSHAAIHISGGGAVAVVVGMVAIVSLVVAVAIAWVGWQQTIMVQQEVQRLQESSDMHQAMIIRINGKLEREPGSVPNNPARP